MAGQRKLRARRWSIYGKIAAGITSPTSMKHIKYLSLLITRFFLFSFSVVIFSHPAQAAAASATTSHLGPTINVTVQRGDETLPIYWVNHLKKGDKVIVSTDQAKKTDKKWLLLLATVTPISNLVTTRSFDLAGSNGDESKTDPAKPADANLASIDIEADDQIPVIVIAPQVRTMFGLHTSFSQSASLISDAINADPQRFIDLQKIDQINHAINYLLHVLDALILNKKTDQAVDAAKTLAAKFGVKYVDPDCFKDSTVNTKCVAAFIVSSADLAVPSDDIWSAAGPNAASVKMPTDFFASLKLMTETGTYLANKYGDNYDFAPSLGQRLRTSSEIQLFTSARFKGGDVKTAYVYVPSWFEGKTPEVTMDNKIASCLTKKDMTASVKGNIPLLNYWHDWNLVLREHGTDKTVALFKSVDFRPDTGMFFVDSTGTDLALNGQLLDATLTGKFGFADVKINPFHVVLPTNVPLAGQLTGIDNLIAGEQPDLIIKDGNHYACVQQMNLLVNDAAVATNSDSATPLELKADLNKVEPGAATLEIQQYGAPTQKLAVTIFKRRAHLQKITHHDLETTLTVTGDNLDRIDLIQLANKLICHPADDAGAGVGATAITAATATTASRNFVCPDGAASNAGFPDKVSVSYKESEPAPFDFKVTKLAARPHMIIDGTNAIITKLSASALQWNLSPTDLFVSEDSGLGFLLHAFDGYKLSRGTYQLQLKFADDPQTEATPISVPLMVDLTHNELRTKTPVMFGAAALPSVVNPLWYRVVHQPSGLAGDWQPLYRSIIYLPQLTALSCDAGGGSGAGATYVHGSQLELIDHASASDALAGADTTSTLTQCDQDQCLALKGIVSTGKLKVKLHWIDTRVFDVSFPAAPSCAANTETANTEKVNTETVATEKVMTESRENHEQPSAASGGKNAQ